MQVYGLVAGRRGNNAPDKNVVNALNGSLSRSLRNVLLPLKDLAESEIEFLGHVFQRFLRELVDAWIDTGRTENGEEPWSRVVPQWEVLQDFVRRNPPGLQMSPEGPFLVIIPHTWDERKNISESVKDAARAMFLQLLDSQARVRLFRCDGCTTYFMRSRSPKRDTPIYRGAYCPKCKRNGKDRTRRTEDGRTGRREKMVAWAVDAWMQWRSELCDGKRKEWVVNKVNEQLPAEWNKDPIKVNWVTWHLPEIEGAAERRKHATRQD